MFNGVIGSTQRDTLKSYLVGLLGLVLVATGCSKPNTPSTTTTNSHLEISSGSTSTTLGQFNSDWPTYYGTIGRSGVDISSPQAVDTSTAWTNPIASKVYAQPLIVNGQVILADEGNNVTSLDLSTGKVTWTVNLGNPVAGSSLPCGNIDPSGITGTPVVDPQEGKLWVVAFIQPTTTTSGGSSTSSTSSTPTSSAPQTTSSTQVPLGPPYHELFTLSLSNGAVLGSQNIDPTGANPYVEQQRGALTFANGYVYIPYGGLYGDCGDYHGFLQAVPVNFKAPTLTFETPASSQAGIWDPAGAVVIGGGDLVVASGNGSSTTTIDGGNTVTELSQLLGPMGTFTPSNSEALNQDDLDLGSTNPVYLPGGYIFIAGKQGIGYILNASSLGGVGGQLFEGEVCSKGAIGGAIYSGGYVYVSCNSSLVALKISKTTFQVAWKSQPGKAGPPIISGGNVWYVDITTGTLFGLNPLTAQVVNQYPLGSVVSFTSPAAASGYLVVVGGGLVQAFNE